MKLSPTLVISVTSQGDGAFECRHQSRGGELRVYFKHRVPVHVSVPVRPDDVHEPQGLGVECLTEASVDLYT